MSLGLALHNREDRCSSLVWGRLCRIDFVNERQAADRLLQDHVNRLGLDVLQDLRLGPSPSLKPFPEDVWSTTENDGEIRVHEMTVMALEECDLGRDPEVPPEALDVDLVGLPTLVAARDEPANAGFMFEIHDRITSSLEDRTDGRLARAGSARDGDNHGGAEECAE